MNIAGVLGRSVAMGSLCLALANPAFSTSEPAWPNYAIRIVSLQPQASVDDPISRPLALALKKTSKFQVALQYHPHNGQPSGLEVIASSVPNGQTVGVLGNDLDAQNLLPLTLIAQTPLVIAVHPGQDYRSFQDIVRAAKRQPGKVLVGSPGPRSSGQLAIEQFNVSQNITLIGIAYQSSGPLIADLISGAMAVGVVPLSAVLPHAKAGRIRVLGISSKARDPRLPDARPLAEQGLENFELHSWWGAFGALAISQDIAGQISARLAGLSQDDELKKLLHAQGIDLLVRGKNSLEQAIQADAVRWASAKQNTLR